MIGTNPEPNAARLNVVKVIDQWGWAYDFVNREQQQYSQHNILVQKYDDVCLDGAGMLYLHCPDIDVYIREDLPLLARSKGIPVIGGYAGDTTQTYAHADAIVCTSPQTYEFALRAYSCPVLFLLQGIDTAFFIPRQNRPSGAFAVGWAGRPASVKRPHLLDLLDFPVVRKTEYGPQVFLPSRRLQPMLDFYHAIDALVLPSLSECCPRVVLEACACGLPVVATDVGSMRYLLDEHWIVPTSPERLVVRVMNARLRELQDYRVRREVGRSNRERAEKMLSWEKLQPAWDAAFAGGWKQAVEHAEAHWGTACPFSVRREATTGIAPISPVPPIIESHVPRGLVRSARGCLREESAMVRWATPKRTSKPMDHGAE